MDPKKWEWKNKTTNLTDENPYPLYDEIHESHPHHQDGIMPPQGILSFGPFMGSWHGVFNFILPKMKG